MAHRTVNRLLVVSTLAALLVGVAVSPAALGVPNKPFSADVFPTCLPAGATVTLTVTIRNDTSRQQLGSANVTAPAGFTIVAATPPATAVGNVVQLRELSLPPGGSTTATFTATTPGAAGTYSWHAPSTAGAGTIIAKQSNDFSGPPGNDLTFAAARSHVQSIVGTCELVYLTQPNDAEVGANVTATQVTPTGTPVRLEVQDGSGNRVTTANGPVSLAIVAGTGAAGASLTPATPTVDAVSGLASFDAATGDGFAIDTAGVNYRLRASGGPGIAPVDSLLSPTDPGFDIAHEGVVCGGPGCTGQAEQDGVTVDVTAPNAQAGDVIVIALDVEPLACPGYTSLSGVPVATFSVSGSSFRVVTITVPASLATRPAAQDRVCYSSALSFVDRSGTTVPPGGSGLLADCKNQTPISQPCQFKTVVDPSTGDHIVSFRAPAGATRGRT